ncbi:MAG: nitrogen fixation protein NifQ [Campylobacterota bacterium]|nr:nitrogen fixation protein NifQ [Campylobacterota bacterium]
MSTSIEILEEKVTALLVEHAVDSYARDEIAPHVAKTSLMMRHLYEDLGLRNRFEMGQYMKRHFPTLFQLKPKDILWKKFIYDSVGEVAPACATCKDQISCFACRVA